MNERMILFKQPNERASLGFAILEYLRLSKDALSSGKKKKVEGLLCAWHCVGPLGFYG